MKKFFLLAIFILYSFSIYAQNQLKVYNPPAGPIVFDDPANNIFIPIEPPVNPQFIPSNYNIEQNKIFNVRVSSDNSNWFDVFAHTTYASNGIRTIRSKASFVSFDFSGTVYIEVTVNRDFIPNVNFNNAGTLMIRPQSKNITPYYKNGNVFRFAISNPAKLSIEVNGLRDRNLQIFANPINNYIPTGNNVKIFNPGIHNLSSNPANPYPAGTKVYIKNGAVVIGDIATKNNDEIYIEGGGILKGNITINGKNNVKIHGHGIIDLSNYAKEYAGQGPDFQRRSGVIIINSSNIEVKGITVNDSQLTGIFLEDSDYITIENFKLFTRVIWGDGIHMKGTSNVTINDCYLRTADDAIAIYASRRNQTNNPSDPFEDGYLNRPALNIYVTNSSLYADSAHPVEVGWHGNYNTGNNGLDIYNLFFENIDILEQDSTIKNLDGSYNRDFEGALSINCSDGNKCSNILFKDIRIEDFSSGRLFTVKVEPNGQGAGTTSGKKVSFIRFENITYNGTGETSSVISGIDCERYVDGVHFENFKVNGTLITKLSDYRVNGINMINVDDYAYNITFQEANNYSLDLPEGYYKIKNISGGYLEKKPNIPYVRNSDFDTYNIWKISLSPGTAHYKIKSHFSNYVIQNTDFPIGASKPSCQRRFLETFDPTQTSLQEWKIVGNNSTGFTINNAYTRAYITKDYLVASAGPSNGTSSQRWQFIPVNVTIPSSARTITDNELTTYPNPVNDILTVNAGSSIISKVVISDINGRTVLNKNFTDEHSVDIDMTGYEAGIYIAIISSDTGEIIKKIIKQ